MFSVLIPVGPGDADLHRLDDLLSSIRRHARTSEIQLVLIDDAPSRRHLEDRCGSGWRATDIIQTPIWKKGRPDARLAMTVGTLCGMVAASLEAEFVLKLDTDALIVGEFAKRLSGVFAADPQLGIVGSYDRTCTGGIRDWSVWVPALKRATRRISLRSPRRVTAARRLLAAALARGQYELGAHCLGGAYAVSPALARRRDLLRWEPWVGSGLGEDVVMGVLCAAAGLHMQSMTATGEPFGLSHVGLPGPPEWLLARGHSIVHAVKDPDTRVEADMRARLQEAAA